MINVGKEEWQIYYIYIHGFYGLGSGGQFASNSSTQNRNARCFIIRSTSAFFLKLRNQSHCLFVPKLKPACKYPDLAESNKKHHPKKENAKLRTAAEFDLGQREAVTCRWAGWRSSRFCPQGGDSLRGFWSGQVRWRCARFLSMRWYERTGLWCFWNRFQDPLEFYVLIYWYIDLSFGLFPEESFNILISNDPMVILMDISLFLFEMFYRVF